MELVTQPKVYPPIGHCIYCGSDNEELSKEHIIPLGLGGNLILPKASCRSCAEITRDIEQFCLRPMLGPLRIRLRLPTRRKKERPNELPIEFIKIDGEKEQIVVPSQEFPLVCIGFRFPAPDILRGNKPNDAVEGDLVVRYVDGEIHKHLNSKGKRVKLGTFELLKFSRMLAKIAHSYAIAELGEDAFRPLLPDLILGKSSESSYLVGGDVSAIPPDKEPFLHAVYPQHCLSNGIEYVLVAIRLFAFIGMPRYHVVVGQKI